MNFETVYLDISFSPEGLVARAWLLVGVCLGGCNFSTASVPLDGPKKTTLPPDETPEQPVYPDPPPGTPEPVPMPTTPAPPPVGEPLALGNPREWKLYEVAGAKCRNGSPAGIGVSPNPGSDKLLLYFEGGGACFDANCEFTAFDIPFLPPSDGIFDRNQAENPLRDWNMVYVPYCTGDVFGGDAPDTVINDALGRSIVNQFVGYKNVGLFLARIIPTFPQLKQVLLTGVSAGGFGAGVNAERVQRAFGSIPVVLVDDSGPPMSERAISRCLQKKWREVWRVDRTFLAGCGADCPDPDDYTLDMMRHLLKTFPKSVGGLFSNDRDAVIRGFYGFGKNDCAPSLFDPLVPADTYRAELLDIRAEVASLGGQFGTYLVDGIGHTCLRGTCFTSQSVDGVKLTKWLADLLDGKAAHVGN